ncbi:MAG: GlsB/YeaQ/YmgE family stress response membrane protein [Planctomycetota bacterium]
MLSLIYFLLIGLAAGWLAAQLLGAGNAGLLWMLVVGVIGSFVGGLLIALLGFSKRGPIAGIITATIGAVVFVALLRRFG